MGNHRICELLCPISMQYEFSLCGFSHYEELLLTPMTLAPSIPRIYIWSLFHQPITWLKNAGGRDMRTA